MRSYDLRDGNWSPWFRVNATCILDEWIANSIVGDYSSTTSTF